MACFSPLRAWQSDAGEILFAERGKIARELVLPCGQCVGCKLARSREWAMRCMHESQLYDENCFVTLTYDDAHVPSDGSLCYRDFQLFMKRLRKELGRVRFFMCGEYGERFFRPHFHACLFGVSFRDRVLFRVMESGSNLYTSKQLSSLWTDGFSSVGDVTFESAAYVARYVLKKSISADARDFGFKPGSLSYRLDGTTGEVVFFRPEFNRMSLKPGIGYEWFRKYRTDVFEHDYVIVNGFKVKPPRFYDRCLSVLDPDSKDFVDLVRYKRSFSIQDDCSSDRLLVRAHCARARLRFKLRSLG